MASLDSTGLTTASQAEILAQIETDQTAEIGDRLDLSTSSPHGQLNRLVARTAALLEEALAAVYASIDPDTAAGDALLRLCALSGTIREVATYSRADMTLNLDAGTYLAGSLVFHETGRPTERFVNIADVTSTGGATSGVLFDCEITGPVLQPATPVLVPVAGWNSIVSFDVFTPGRDVETEAALRLRRNLEVESPGSSSASGIVADLTRTIPAIISAFVTENDTDGAVDSIPAHSIEVVVYGPTSPSAADDQAVADQILASKAAGIGTYGTTTKTAYDSEGIAHEIKFTRPAAVALTPTLSISVSPTEYEGDAAVKAKILERAAETYVPGLDGAWSQVVAWAMEVGGVYRVTAINLGAGAFADVAIESRKIATIAELDITITSTETSP